MTEATLPRLGQTDMSSVRLSPVIDEATLPCFEEAKVRPLPIRYLDVGISLSGRNLGVKVKEIRVKMCVLGLPDSLYG